jgi:prophage maintenance system killer protein/prophage antirepressor-like protein
MKNKQKLSNVVIYQAPNGALELKGDIEKETIWANQSQIVDLFGVDQSVISRHIKNIFKDDEVDQKSNMQKMHIPNSDKPVVFYSLDVILSVGYRTNSKVAIQFRKWATNTLRDHLLQGYTINKKLLEKNYTLFQKALTDMQKISQNKLSSNDVLELVKAFSQTWFSLDAFDKGELQATKQAQESIKLEAKKLYEDLAIFKRELLEQKQATELFAEEKQKGSLEGILGNVFQTVFGQDVYPSIESKASHLLYFIVKNHPFNDGNKRSGAFAFIWFLQKAKYTFQDKITPEALTAITLMIAISDPKEKQKMVELVILLLIGK